MDNIHDKYALGKELGRGSFGVVYEAKAHGGKVTVAIKSLAKANVGDETMAQLMCNEIYVLQKTDHPNIVRVFELLEDSDNFYVVMELLSCGDLSKTIAKQKAFTETMATSIMHQVLKGLNYMHGQGIMHRDLKPENIMCFEEADGKISAKLTDFGFACVLKSEDSETLSCGSPLYMAPEVVSHNPYDKRADVWSLGVIVYFMLSGQFPFWGNSLQELEMAIMTQPISFAHEAFSHVSLSGKSFI